MKGKVYLNNQHFGNICSMKLIPKASNFNCIKCKLIFKDNAFLYNPEFLYLYASDTVSFESWDDIKFELKSIIPVNDVEKSGEIKFQLKKEYKDLENSIPDSIIKLLMESHKYFK